jgi:putative intracellular protease/amidase
LTPFPILLEKGTAITTREENDRVLRYHHTLHHIATQQTTLAATSHSTVASPKNLRPAKGRGATGERWWEDDLLSFLPYVSYDRQQTEGKCSDHQGKLL